MNSSRDSNYLAPNVGSGFQKALVDLVYKTRESAIDLVANGSAKYSFKEEYLASEFLSKYMDSTTVSAPDRKAAAITKWKSAELKNRTTNFRLGFDPVDFGWATSEDLNSQIREWVHEILGPLDAIYPEFLLNGGYTNGASTRVRRSPVAAFLKHVGQAHVTPAALNHWSLATGGTLLEDQELSLVSSSDLFTVPKKTEIDRVACKEPEVNLFLQRAVGSHIRKSLRRCGIDLNDQTVNQRMAKRAVQTGHATIDLSAASDSITSQLVAEWLPADWFSLLNDLRVESTRVDGSIHHLEMFSSMGNGFTFELESLLFFLITRFVCMKSRIKGRISVYGDDIIAPNRCARRLARVFQYYGFSVNSDKSFWDGPFRESCGKHYYHRLDVTPFFIREPVTTQSDVIRLLNRLLVWDSHDGYLQFTTKSVSDFHQKWRDVVPRSLWGGQDPEDITSLVSGHLPRKRLTQKSRSLRKKQQPDVEFGAYLYWSANRREEVISLDPTMLGKFRLSKQPDWLTRNQWNPYELFMDSPACTDIP